MGAYEGAEFCELVGIFTVYQLLRSHNKNSIGLCRDDGLALLNNIIGPQAETNSKYFQNMFHKNNLSIIIKCNLKLVDYVDVIRNLSDGL